MANPSATSTVRELYRLRDELNRGYAAYRAVAIEELERVWHNETVIANAEPPGPDIIGVGDLAGWLSITNMSLRDMYIDAFAIFLNAELLRPWNRKLWAGGYEQKKKLVELINSRLRPAHATLTDPQSHAPAILYAISSYDKLGRFTFENRFTRKRKGSFKSLDEFFPLRCFMDYPRKEGLAKNSND